jgi:hypothetical protein
MRFNLGITTKYIDHHPTISITNNPLTGISSENPSSIKLRTTDNYIKQSVLCKQNEYPWTQECCFLPSGNSISTILEVSVTPPDSIEA